MKGAVSIKRSLNGVVIAACTIMLLFACAALAIYEMMDFRRTLTRDMVVLADVIVRNSQASIAFQDEAAAEETLRALEADPYVESACLYLADGDVLASFVRSGEQPEFPAVPEADGIRFDDGRLVLHRPVILNGKRVGTMRLQASLQGLHERLLLFGLVAGAVLGGSICLAYLLASRLQRPITEPILALTATAKKISERKDYSARAESSGRCSEIDTLTESFNEMLSVIEAQERDLRSSNRTLSDEIAERSLAETRVKAQLARLELLSQITRAIGERQDVESVLQVVAGSLEKDLGADLSCVLLYRPTENDLVVSGVARGCLARAREAGLTESSRVPVDGNGLSRCIQGQLVHEPDIGQVAFPFPERLARTGLRSLVIAPLLVESQVFGVVVVARLAANAFSSGECEFIRQLCEHAALAAHQAQLHGALQQAYNELRQTQQAVMQHERLKALGQMASGIAHDINNAISPVALYTESLLENETGLGPRARSYLETIQRAIDDVAQTVARMREFYRQREPEMVLVPVQFNQLVRQVVDLSRARWSDMPQQRGVMIDLVVETSPDLPVVLGVESELREALINLVFNAVDAMPEGGTLMLRTRHEPGRSHPMVHVEVSDTGVGMDEDTRRRCLEPFYTTKGERGTGLGLAMVYGTARRHGADLEIESVRGKGTTMRLVFSAADPVSKTAPTGHRRTGRLPSRLHLLAVDDDPVLLRSLCDILEADGHRVVTAPGGAEGIAAFTEALAGKEPFAAVITDLGMPHIDGRKVAAAIKAASPATPVIMLTGWGRRMIADGEVPPHVDHVLGKPPKLREIRDALSACVAGGGDGHPPREKSP